MNYSVSIIRILSMIIIVLYHCICPYGIWKTFCSDITPYSNIEAWRSLCNVALYSFVLISGYLYAYLYLHKNKYRQTSTFLSDKSKRLLLPYLVWSIPALLLYGNSNFVIDFISGFQHLWFLLMLYGLFLVVAPLIRFNSKTIIGGIAVLLILNVVINKWGDSYPNYLSWKMIFRYAPAFLWGILLVKAGWIEKLEKKSVPLLIVLNLFAVVGVIVIASMQRLPLGGFYAPIPTFVLLTFLTALVGRIKIEKLPIPLHSLDKNCMGIYILHHLFIWFILFYIPVSHEVLNSHPIAAPSILFPTVFVLSWIMAVLINRSKLRCVFGSK